MEGECSAVSVTWSLSPPSVAPEPLHKKKFGRCTFIYFIIMCPPLFFFFYHNLRVLQNISCIDFLLERKLAGWHLGCFHIWTCWFVPNQSACFSLWVVLSSHCIMVKRAKAHAPSTTFLTALHHRLVRFGSGLASWRQQQQQQQNESQVKLSKYLMDVWAPEDIFQMLLEIKTMAQPM